MSNSRNTAKKSSCKDKETVFWTPPQSLVISENSSPKVTPKAIREWLMSLRLDSPASRSVSQESSREKMTQEICGLPQKNVLASYDHSTHCWRTSQVCLLTGIQDEFSETWPKWGTMRTGELSERITPGHLTSGIDSGSSARWATPAAQDSVGSHGGGQGRSLRTDISNWKKGMWPTPQARDYRSGDQIDGIRAERKREQGWSPGLNDVVKWPTPAARDSKGANSLKHCMETGTGRKHMDQLANFVAHGTEEKPQGQLNPAWVETYLMAWPCGWSNLKPLKKEVFNAWKKIFWKFDGTQKSQEDFQSNDVFGLRLCDRPNQTPHRQKPLQQQKRKCSDIMPPMSQQASCCRALEGSTKNKNMLVLWEDIQIQEAEGKGVFSFLRSEVSVAEQEQRFYTESKGKREAIRFKKMDWMQDPADTGKIPRVAQKIPNRISRLKALGNGQVPACVVLAWRILNAID